MPDALLSNYHSDCTMQAPRILQQVVKQQTTLTELRLYILGQQLSNHE